MSDLQTTANARNPLLLSEIVDIVYANAKTKDSLHLAMTCRPLFHSLMPLLWQRVRSVKQLFYLIPGTVITESHTERGPQTMAITISESAVTKSWERYWVYAHFVKYLTLYHHCGSITLDGWSTLFAKLNFEGLLLPNLEQLIINEPEQMPSDITFDPINQLALLRFFLSPSLEHLELIDYAPTSDDAGSRSQANTGLPASSPSALMLIKILAKSLPCAQSVPLPPYYDDPTEWMSASAGQRALKECISWFEHSPAPINLIQLHIYSCAVSGGLGEGLIVLGHLPYLETLEIEGSLKSESQLFFQGEPLPIPSGLFPRLRFLSLRSIPGTQLFYHIWSSQAMVSGLTCALVVFDMHSPVSQDEFTSKIIPLLCVATPKLATLGLTVPIEDQTNASLPVLDLLCELLSHLPLSILAFYCGKVVASAQSSRYLPQFPLLRILNLSTPLPPSQLRILVASLPNLGDIWLVPHPEIVEPLGNFNSEQDEPASLQPISVDVQVSDFIYNYGWTPYRIKQSFPNITR
ncbi:unnamed protein product [Rhizoctonia solani]|uniref:Uncharacterized protein n=1 Tax=Rhizoctonia solani TaxID=456999 RepID=A0A8H2Y220_9AGAM|nr:unnamed protein product [Rhizoctonia solani]